MAVESVGEKYRCNVCGNEVKVTRAGGGTLVCCGKDMELTDELDGDVEEEEEEEEEEEGEDDDKDSEGDDSKEKEYDPIDDLGESDDLDDDLHGDRNDDSYDDN